MALKGGTSWFERIVVGQLEKMPKAVRIFVYLISFALLVYTELLPREIQGRLIIEGAPDVKFTDAHLRYWVGSNWTNVTINEGGGWAIPLWSRIPISFPLELQIGGPEWKKVRIGFGKVLASRFMEAVEITIHREGDTYKFSVADKEAGFSKLLVSDASAEETVVSTPKPSTEWHDVVANVLNGFLKNANSSVSENDRIASLMKNPIDLSVALTKIETDLRIAIPPEDKKTDMTLGDLLAVVEKQLALGRHMRAALPNVLRAFVEKGKLYVAPNIEPAMLSQATSAYANPQTWEALGLIDATVFGSATQGMIFSDQGIYYKTRWTRSNGPEMTYIPYQRFTQVTVAKAGIFEVDLGNYRIFVTSGSGFSAEDLVVLLGKVQDVARKALGE